MRRLEIAALVGALLAAVGVLALALGRVIDFNNFPLGAAVILSILTYLIFKYRSQQVTSPPNPKLDLTNHHFRVLVLIFLLLIIGQLLLIHSTLYSRPLAFFILQTIAAIAIGLQVFLPRKTTFQTCVIVAEILLLGIILRASIFYVSPGFHSSDSWAYSKLAQDVLQSGSIDDLSIQKMRDFPSLALTPAMFMSITSLGVKTAFFLSVTVPYVLSTVFVFLIGSKLHSKEAGLLALLLLVMADIFVVRSVISITPMLVVLPCALFIFYLFLRSRRAKLTLLAIVAMASMIISHQASTVMSFILIVALFVGAGVHRVVNKQERINTVVTQSLLLLFLVGIVGYWMNAWNSEDTTMFDAMVKPIGKAFTESDVGYTGATYSFGYDLSAISTIMWQLGHLLLIFLGVLGAFIWAFQRDVTPLRSSVVFAAILVAMIVYGNLVIGMVDLRPTRWAPFLALFLTLFAAGAMIEYLCIERRNIIRIAAVVLGIFLVVFFNVTSPLINNDSPIYAKDRASNVHLEVSEFQAFHTLWALCGSDNFIVADRNLGPTSRSIDPDSELDKVTAFRLDDTGLYEMPIINPSIEQKRTSLLQLDNDDPYVGAIATLRYGQRVDIGEKELSKLDIDQEILGQFVSHRPFNKIYHLEHIYAFAPSIMIHLSEED
ncbi:MAG: hypothetical protein GY861_13010 [bacterium]|nr:hypothetical protein [bacterium]